MLPTMEKFKNSAITLLVLHGLIAVPFFFIDAFAFVVALITRKPEVLLIAIFPYLSDTGLPPTWELYLLSSIFLIIQVAFIVSVVFYAKRRYWPSMLLSGVIVIALLLSVGSSFIASSILK